MPDGYKGAERRIPPRVLLKLRFKYKILSFSGVSNVVRSALTNNISSSGLLFESQEQIPIETEVKIYLEMPGFPPHVFEIKGKVVRIEKLLSASNFDIGIIFTDIPAGIKEEIKIRIDRMDIMKLLEAVNVKEISDLHLTVNSPPMVRRYGELVPLERESLSEEQIKQMVFSILSEEQKKNFEANKDLDYALSPSVNSRFRVSIYQQRGRTEVVFRHIMPNIKSREDLGLPDVIEGLCKLKNGLVIIGGTTGSGKSTTIATMIDIINKKRGGVVLSLEKPLEYLHKNIKAIVKQREVGIDVPSFASGIKAALRQDPDVIVVGEILDYDTIETALQAAETGHLVITSLHATDTIQIFDRIISFFPPEQMSFILSRLSHSLKATIIQKILPNKSGTGRVLATELCVINMAVNRVIRNGDFPQLFSIIQTGSQQNMHLMQKSIDSLLERGQISDETYEEYSKTLNR
jgi:twitching motility protein PilT